MAYIQQHYAWFIATVVAIGCLLVTLGVNKRRSEKAFGWRILTNAPLIRRHASAPSKLQITYDERPIGDLRLLEIEYLNTGGKEISADDVVIPLTLVFPKDIEVIEPEVTKIKPDNTLFDPQLEVVGTSVVFAPTLMNLGNSFVFKVLATTAKNQEPVLQGRIKGISLFTNYKPPGVSILISDFLMIVCCSFLVLGVVDKDPAQAAANAYRKLHPPTPEFMLLAGGVLFTLLLAAAKLLHDVNSIKKSRGE